MPIFHHEPILESSMSPFSPVRSAARSSVLALTLALLSGLPAFAIPLPDPRPALVSPGGSERPQEVADGCVTFSWSSGASRGPQELVIYRLDEAWNVPETPVRTVPLPPGATSWTPSSDQCLEPGRYAWAVGMTAGSEDSAWSEPAWFVVSRRGSVDVPPLEEPAFRGEDMEREELAEQEEGSESREDGKGRARSSAAGPPSARALTGTAAIRGENPTVAGAAHGIVGVASSPGGAGVVAGNLSGGPDLLLDGGPLPDAALSELGLDLPSASPRTFEVTNSAGGGVQLTLDGDPVVTKSRDSDLLASLSCPSLHVAEWDGSQWGCTPTPTDPLAGLVCADGDQLAWWLGGWTCAAPSVGPHDHFAEVWTGGAAQGLRVENTNGDALVGKSTESRGIGAGVHGISTYGQGVLGEALDTTSAGAIGVEGRTASGAGRGVLGAATASAGYGIGVEGITYSSQYPAAGVVGTARATTGRTYGVRGENPSEEGAGVAGFSGGGTGVLGEALGYDGVAVRGTQSEFEIALEGSHRAVGVLGEVGISAGPHQSAIGVFGEAISSQNFGGSSIGVQGISNAVDAALGVVGLAPSTEAWTTFPPTGVSGSAAAPGGQGVLGTSTAGTGIGRGVVGRSSSSLGVGVEGEAQAGTGTTVGVRGVAASGEGRAVEGEAIAPSGPAVGVHGSTISPSGTGVVGAALAETLAVEGGGVGVHGFSQTPNGVGVLAEHTESPGIALWARGHTADVALLATGDAGTHSAIVTPLSVGHVLPPETALHVEDDVANVDGPEPSLHVALIRNTTTSAASSVLALQSAIPLPGADTNFVTFFAGSTPVGAIEGSSGGISIKSASGDFAEWLPRRDLSEFLRPGDVVGLRGGAVSLETRGAERILVVSDTAIVSGRDPGEADRHRYAQVAFLGQVPVRTRGPVEAGDLLVASGRDDGIARAVAPAVLRLDDAGSVVGRALESSLGVGEAEVLALVGADGGALAGLASEVRTMRDRLSVFEERLLRLESPGGSRDLGGQP